MKIDLLKKNIEKIWKMKDRSKKSITKKDVSSVTEAINNLDSGKIRIAEKKSNKWNSILINSVWFNIFIPTIKAYCCMEGRTANI